MRKRGERYFLISVVLLLAFIPKKTLSQGKDSSELKHAKLMDKAFVLVIPFRPDMYSANGDQYICYKSKLNPGQLSDLIRRSFMNTLMYNMNDLYNT